uniref:USP domain-containing protein n=1 Tax=Heterorhabditis bacteriophora TaxID=37862 RepID=A0A1I7WQK8_HETBA
MSSDGFQDNITDNTPITSVPGRDVYAVELFPTMKDLMNETINILFCLTIRQGYDITSNISCDFFKKKIELSSLLFLDFHLYLVCIFWDVVYEVKYIRKQNVESNDYHQGGYIEDGVTVPLFTEVVEAQLTMNEKSHPDLPRFIRVAVECPTNTKLLYASGDSITNHVSAECLFKEKTDPDTSIINCLTEFTNEEQLDWRCDKCEKRGGVKRILFRSLPQILIFHLKRFRQVRGGSSNEYVGTLINSVTCFSLFLLNFHCRLREHYLLLNLYYIGIGKYIMRGKNKPMDETMSIIFAY